MGAYTSGADAAGRYYISTRGIMQKLQDDLTRASKSLIAQDFDKEIGDLTNNFANKIESDLEKSLFTMPKGYEIEPQEPIKIEDLDIVEYDESLDL